LLEFEGSIEPVACEALSLVAFAEKGKAKKMKVIRSKKKSRDSWISCVYSFGSIQIARCGSNM
jgi:hypothetical protein